MRYTLSLNIYILSEMSTTIVGHTVLIPLRIHWSGLIVITESIEDAQHHLSAEPVEL